jgi:putative spermidine/putrescine transport system permease protein
MTEPGDFRASRAATAAPGPSTRSPLFHPLRRALYGPMICIYILSFQDIRGGLVFPMKGHSLHWFVDLFTQVRTGDVKGSFDRSIKLAVLVTVITLVVSLMADWRFAAASSATRSCSTDDRQPGGAGLVLGLGIGLLFQWIGISRAGTPRARAQAVLDAAVRRAGDVRRDVPLRQRVGGGGARSRRHRWQTDPAGVIPVLAPGLVAVALFGFTLSYDEFARTLQTAARSTRCRSRSGA